MDFRTSEILPSKNKVKQTDSGLARRQNNGDTKPSFRKPVYHHRFSNNEFSPHRGFLEKNTWWSWQEDPSGHDYRAIFLFSPASIRYANKSSIINLWSYTSRLGMAFRCLYCYCFSPRGRPNPWRVLPSPSWHPWNPYTVSVQNGL